MNATAEWTPPWRTKLVAWLEAGTEFDRILRVALLLTPLLRLATFRVFDSPFPWLTYLIDLEEQRGGAVARALRILATNEWGALAACQWIDVLLLWKDGRCPIVLQRGVNLAWFLLAALGPAIGGWITAEMALLWLPHSR